ncbi:5532_t:CDS:2 [Scutellospora calospora]|uniref:5532_t:CDS:1 n=1 Tax=Scutellospora calospora TaxID=85575 RepID=A0ACA9LJ64_9GLOM|nr:5532_t:CDS:2 [Scutellospora calospora]
MLPCYRIGTCFSCQNCNFNNQFKLSFSNCCHSRYERAKKGFKDKNPSLTTTDYISVNEDSDFSADSILSNNNLDFSTNFVLLNKSSDLHLELKAMVIIKVENSMSMLAK